MIVLIKAFIVFKYDILQKTVLHFSINILKRKKVNPFKKKIKLY